MTVAISPSMQEARLNADLATIGGAALLRIYGGTRPAAGASTAATMLAQLPLANPPGAVMGNQLILTPLDNSGVTVLATGDATWARLVDGSGQWLLDCDVAAFGGDWQISIQDQPPGVPPARLYAGSVFYLGTVALQ